VQPLVELAVVADAGQRVALGAPAPLDGDALGPMGADEGGAGQAQSRQFENMLKETIFAATQKIRAARRENGQDDWCVSVFKDNAGIIRFDDKYNLVFKAETHNHPSAIEPFGGANTGVGGVILDRHEKARVEDRP